MGIEVWKFFREESVDQIIAEKSVDDFRHLHRLQNGRCYLNFQIAFVNVWEVHGGVGGVLNR